MKTNYAFPAAKVKKNKPQKVSNRYTKSRFNKFVDETMRRMLSQSGERPSVVFFKDTHMVKTPSNKTPALRKSTNMGVWAVGTLNQLFIRGSLTETKLSKK